MALSVGARPGMNNPGDLTVSRSNPNLYADDGQTSVYNSPNGLSYPVFATVADGWNALVEWIQSNIGSNDATSITTPSELASYYLNGSFGPLTSNALNPHAQNWLSSFLKALGISNPNAQLSQFKPSQIATAISVAEGTSGTFGSFSGNAGVATQQVVGSNANLTPFQVGVQTLANDPGTFFGTLFGGSITPTDIAVNGATTTVQLAGNGANQVTGDIAGAVAAGVGQATAPLTSWFQGLTSSDTVSRVSIGIVAVILLAAGIFFLAGNKTTTINVASLKGAVA